MGVEGDEPVGPSFSNAFLAKFQGKTTSAVAGKKLSYVKNCHKMLIS